MLRMCWAPMEGGYIPVMIVVLAGAQTGAQDQASSKIMPIFAIASTLGVVANSSP
jgi:hypothetical protein